LPLTCGSNASLVSIVGMSSFSSVCGVRRGTRGEQENEGEDKGNEGEEQGNEGEEQGNGGKERGNGAATAERFLRAWCPPPSPWKALDLSGPGGGSGQVTCFREGFLRFSGCSLAEKILTGHGTPWTARYHLQEYVQCSPVSRSGKTQRW
jgi:hypothetical protein